MPAIITLKQLKEKGACLKSRIRFKAFFGKSVEITEELARKHSKDFSWHWAANAFLDPDLLEKFRNASDAAWDTFYAAVEKMEVEFGVHSAYVYAEDEVERRAIQAKINAYIAGMRPVNRAYAEARAVAFAREYIKQEADK